MINKRIGIIGCGNMGEALLAGLARVLDKSTALMVSEMDAPRRDYIRSKYRIIVEIDNNLVVKCSDVIILAVKPKDLDAVLRREVCCGISPDKLLISIAAGIPIKYIEKIVGNDVPVIRVMPNMGALIGESMTSMSAGHAAGRPEMGLAAEIFSTIGDVIEVDEKHVDAVTAVSGSGPAYFFYLAESIIEAARGLGLSREVAEKIVLKTMLASGNLLNALEDDAAALRARVASKGGTTEAAFKVFKSRKFKAIVKSAVRQACKRSKEISGGKDVRTG